MNNKIVSAATFILGAAIGSFITFKIVKDKSDKIIKEEIDSVKKTFSYKVSNEEDKSIEEIVKDNKNKKNVNDYAEYLVKKNGYINYSDIENDVDRHVNKYNEEKENNVRSINVFDKPYVISPEEFGEFPDYSIISLVYFADEILTDDSYNMVDDIEDLVGYESLNTFGHYEEDSVYVRNDRLKSDFEILTDLRTYSELLSERPYLVED